MADLERSVKKILAVEGVKGRVAVEAGSVVVEGPRPTEVANLLANLPGVSWIAVGQSAKSSSDLNPILARLAKSYVKGKGKFAVRAQSTSSRTKAGDLIGAGTSAVLDAAKGARVDEAHPKVAFRVVFDGRRGAAGVELKRGPGGSPTGVGKLSCLVSGGMHSSVLAWMALLAGLRVEMVHAWVSDEALWEVARLYGELSHRVDPSAISLRVLKGGTAKELLSGWLAGSGQAAFAGFHAECSVSKKGSRLRRVEAPVYLVPEEEFTRELASLGLEGDDALEGWRGGKGAQRPRESVFGGRRADMHGVLDGLS